MNRAVGVLDKLPASVRHLIIVFGASFGGRIVSAIVDAQGVTGVAWLDTLKAALNVASLAAATAIAALYLTPLTRQYGVGKAITSTYAKGGDHEA